MGTNIIRAIQLYAVPAGIRVITEVAVTTVWQTHFGTGFGGAGMGVVYPGISAQLEYIPNEEQ